MKDKRRTAPSKQQADRQTPYLTFLPHLKDGFDPGLHTVPGIVTDGGAQPHRWLDDMSRHMETRERSVAFAIPDVLAAEQQMRRVLRQSPEAAARSPETAKWRGLLALLLLWDSWEKDATWPVLTLEDYGMEDTAFAVSVRSAMGADRRRAGLRLFALTRETERGPETQPLCLLSALDVLVPAADPGDLTELLPRCVTWYDAARGGFQDPAPYLTAVDRARLIAQLQLLQCFNEQAELGSLLYSPDAHLVHVLDRFIRDLTCPLEDWRRALAAEDADAWRDMAVRVKTVFVLRHETDFEGIERLEEEVPVEKLAGSPLTDALRGDDGAALPGQPLTQVVWCFAGVPIARESVGWLLEPSGDPQEGAMLERLAGDIELLEAQSARYRAATQERLTALLTDLEHRQDLAGTVRTLVETCRRHACDGAVPEHELHLTWPAQDGADARRILLHEYLGLDDAEAARMPFSDLAVVAEGANEETLGDAAVCAACLSDAFSGVERTLVLPPLSPALAAALSACTRVEGALRLVPQSFAFTRCGEGDSETLDCAFTLTRLEKREDAVLERRVVLHRRYFGMDGEILHIPCADLPTVTVWPAVPFADKAEWRAYYVYAHQSPALEAWALREGRWQQGAALRDGENAWQVLRTAEYPDFCLLRSRGRSLGVLPNLLPATRLRRAESAVVALDFGTTGTTVMLRQGYAIAPVQLPCLERTLLRSDALAPLSDEFLPDTPFKGTSFSAEDLFSDDPAAWREALVDGHIYTPTVYGEVCRKSVGRLYYDLKWGNEPFRLAARRLYLYQTMLQALLCCRLNGAPDVSWRVATPSAMPDELRDSYLRLMEELAAQVTADCGVPLTPGVPPVRWMSEERASGEYFRARSEVNVRSGYLTLDVGGGTAELSLWLGGRDQPSQTCSLPMGAQSMLLEALLERPGQLMADFGKLLDHPKLTRELKMLTAQFEHCGGRVRETQKCAFLLDAFLGEHLTALTRHMNQRYAQGECTFTQALLLLDFAFLLTLAGQLQDQAGRDAVSRGELRDHMEICMSGRGCLLMAGLAETTRMRLRHFIRLAVSLDNPVKEHVLVVSAAPKQEVARGLLLTDDLDAPVQAPPLPCARADKEDPFELMTQFLLLFRTEFSQAAAQLFPELYETGPEGGLTRRSQMTLRTIVDNHFPAPDGKVQAAYAACLEALKRSQQLHK